LDIAFMSVVSIMSQDAGSRMRDEGRWWKMEKGFKKGKKYSTNVGTRGR
jgi:hypothetical protein